MESLKLIGFNFTKIGAEKKTDVKKEVKINNNINIIDIRKVKTNLLKSSDDVLEVDFSYEINYEPNIAKISLGGIFLISISPKDSKEVTKKWKNKELDDNFKATLFNLVLRKSSIKALTLEEELNLPHHVRMPILKKQPKE